jgi:hypothetical protein
LGNKEPREIGKAEEHIQDGIKILKELEQKPVVYQGYLYLGELYANMGRKDKALETLKTAEAMFQELGMDYFLSKAKEVLERV